MAGLRTVISFHSAYVTARGPLTDVYGGGAAVARQVALRQALLPRGTVTMEFGSSAARVPQGRIDPEPHQHAIGKKYGASTVLQSAYPLIGRKVVTDRGWLP